MKIVITGVDDAGRSTVVESRETTEDVDAWKMRLADVPEWIVGTEKLMSFEPDPGWIKSFAVSFPPEGHAAHNDDHDGSKGTQLDDPHTVGLHKGLTCEVTFAFDPIVLILETGEVELEAGDMIVLRGVMHDWRNPNDHPARLGGVAWAMRR